MPFAFLSPAVYDQLAPFYEPSGLGEYAERFAETLGELFAEEPPPPGRWLDLGCGTGILLARSPLRGRPACGLDLSLGMLLLALARGLAVMRGDVRQLPLRSGSVAVATATFDVANHLAPAPELARFLQESRRILIPGGVLAFDLNTPAHLRLWHGVEEVTSLPGGTLVRRGRFDEARGILTVEMVHTDAEGRSVALGALTERAYPPSLVRGLLRQAGLREIERRVGRRARGFDLRELWTARRPLR